MVTGAGQGLGYCIASEHLENGDFVYGYDCNLSDDLLRLAEKNKNLNIAQCDIGSTSSVSEAVQSLLENGKPVDILYNVAGIYRFEDKVGLCETELDQCTDMFNVNAVGALRMCKAILPLLREGSLIINISSEAGSITVCRREVEYAYCMSKAALNMGSKILSNELYKKSVRVLNVHPGWMRTKMGGPDAFASSHSVSPKESAKNIIEIARHIDVIPRDQLYMQYNRELLPW